MKKRIATLILMCVGSISTFGQAQTLLSLEDALQLTLTNNPQIKASQYEEQAAERERKAAYGLRLPQLGVTGAYSFMADDIGVDLNGAKEPVGNLLQGIGGTGILPPAVLQQAASLLGKDWNIPLQERSFATVGATLAIPLYTGGKINAANNAAKIKIREAQSIGYQDRNSLVSELTERYYGLTLALYVVEVRRQVLEGMRHHLSDAVAMEANGVIARAERLYAEVHAAEAEREYLKAQTQVTTLRSALCNTLGSEMIAYTPVSSLFTLAEIESVDYFKSLALEHNPILKQVNLKQELAVEGVRLQRADFAPQVALMGGASLYNYQLSHMVPRWVVGAGVSFKLFDGLHREYKYTAARSKVRQVEALGVKANHNILTLIDKLYNDMATYHQQLPSIDASRTFATEYLRIKQEAFKEGVSPSTDVVDAQLNLARIKIERLQAAYYYDLMLARLLEACGTSEALPAYGKRASAIAVQFD